MKITPVHYIAPKECPYTYRGRNLAEMRRAKLQRIAKTLEVDIEGSKNELVGRIIDRARALEMNAELSEQ